MAYSPKGVMDIYEIISRWHSEYTISGISHALGVDRKTIRRYIRAAEEASLSLEKPLPPRDELLGLIVPLVPSRERKMPAREQFEAYRDEITDLITRKEDPLKPKSVFEVICVRHGLEASYSSFKRFVRTLDLESAGGRATCRIEVEPGDEIQVDYGYMGLFTDPETNRKRKVYAFVGMLSHGRYKFIEYVFSQDQRSFVASHVRMFAFFGGVTRWITIDNLKSGVIKPDRCDPELNPLYRELADHYGTFIDPARVRQATDKGKVERVVPLARELFRKLKTLHPDMTVAELNGRALEWCRYENGMTVHGTTGEKPAEVFHGREKAALKPLPETTFELATWKRVTVHPDQFRTEAGPVQFEKKTYSIQNRHVGRTIWARGTDKLVQLFDADFRLLKQHVRTSKHRHTDWSDFPEHVQDMFEEKAVLRILHRAAQIGPSMAAYIRIILEPHAKINMRKAQGMLGLADRYSVDALEAAAAAALSARCFKLEDFRRLLENPSLEEEQIPMSFETATYVRSPGYFIHPTSEI